MKTVLSPVQALGVYTACALLAQTGLAQGQKPKPPHYTITDLGPAGNSPGQPLTLRNNGLISWELGVSDSTWHAVLEFHGTRVDLAKTGGLGGPNSAAFGVNERGQAAGEAETGEFDPNKEDFCGFGTGRVCRAFAWQNGIMSALPPWRDPSGAAGRNAIAEAINIHGQAAGVAENTTLDSTCPPFDPTAGQFQRYQFKPVVWEYGNILQLPTFGIDASGKPFNDPDGLVFDMNDSGQAAGVTGTCSGMTQVGTYLHGAHATLWQNGTVTDLGNLGAAGPGFGSLGKKINKWGQVVGVSGTPGGAFHAFYWSPETAMQDLGTLDGDFASVGLGINDAGDTTGLSLNANGPRAFVRPKGGSMVDLNAAGNPDSGLFLLTACSINSRGEIIGFAVDGKGSLHGYLATPSEQ